MTPTIACSQIEAGLDDVALCVRDFLPGEIDLTFVIAGSGAQSLRSFYSDRTV